MPKTIKDTVANAILDTAVNVIDAVIPEEEKSEKIDSLAAVTVKKESKYQEVPRVSVVIPLREEDSTGLKVDMYEHVTVNGETTLVKRGERVDVTVPVYMQLRNKFPNI